MKIEITGGFKKDRDFSIPYRHRISTKVSHDNPNGLFYNVYFKDSATHFAIYADADATITIEDKENKVDTSLLSLNKRVKNYARLGVNVNLLSPTPYCDGEYKATFERKTFTVPYEPPPAPPAVNQVTDGGRNFACFINYDELSNEQKELANAGYDDAERQWNAPKAAKGIVQVIKDPTQLPLREFRYKEQAEMNYKKGYQAFLCNKLMVPRVETFVPWNRSGTGGWHNRNPQVVSGYTSQQIGYLNERGVFFMPINSDVSNRRLGFVLEANTYFGKRYLLIPHDETEKFFAWLPGRFTYNADYAFVNIFTSLKFVGYYDESEFKAEVPVDISVNYPKAEFDKLSQIEQEQVYDAFRAAQRESTATGKMIPLVEGQTLYNNGARLFWFMTFSNNPPQITVKQAETVNIENGKFETQQALDTSSVYKFKFVYNGQEAYFASEIEETGDKDNEYKLKSWPHIFNYFKNIQLVPS